MLFFQLTVDCHDPALLSKFWSRALGYLPVPPAEPDTTWWELYRHRLGDDDAFDDRIFDPDGLRPPLWFQEVPEGKAGKNRLHLDLYPTGRDRSLSFAQRKEIVDTKVAELVEAGASIQGSTSDDDLEDPSYWVVLQDPEGNEFCVS